MNPDGAFDCILASLHRAALDDTHWAATAALIDEACGSVGNILLVREGFGGADRIYYARFLYRGENRQDLAREYVNIYYPHDAGMRRLMQLPEGRPVHLPDLYTKDELRTSPVYNEGWRRLGGQNGLYTHFDEPDGLCLAWGVADPVGNNGWDSDRVALVERLAPHVRRFVSVRQALAAAEALGAGLAGLLDNNRIGVVQLDRSGQVLAANTPALEILRRGDGLLDHDSALQASLPADHSRLQRLLARALPGLWGEPPRGGSMTVQRPSGRSRLGLHVSPVVNGVEDFGGRRMAALVLVVDPARGWRVDPARVERLLGLTSSEGRVAALLAEGVSVRDIAATMGLRETYVRWLFQQIYRKLGVSGQVALVRQVLAADALPRG